VKTLTRCLGLLALVGLVAIRPAAAPQPAAVLDTVGFVYYQRKEYAKAEPILKKAVELGAKVAPIHYHLGMTYYRLGKKDDAIASLKRSLQLDEKLPDAAEARRVLKELGAG